jgi:short-subunit dehydrogenase involved in D-alanine esterification of teichoic acids
LAVLLSIAMAIAEARSVVVTQPNNKLSRVLKALLKEVPSHIQAINNAGLMASMAMSDGAAALAGQQAAEVARGRLQQRLQLIQALQVGVFARSPPNTCC